MSVVFRLLLAVTAILAPAVYASTSVVVSFAVDAELVSLFAVGLAMLVVLRRRRV